MRASTVIALALVAAATPALSAPTEGIYARDAPATTPSVSVDESGAFKINTGLIKDGVDIANGVIDGINGIKNIFSGNNQKREEFVELLARALEDELVARDATVDPSGALSFSTVKDAFNIGKGIFDGVQGISQIFNNNNQQQQKREFEELFARALEEELMARDDATDESGAFKINTGLIKDGVDIANGVIDGVNGIKNFFSGNNQQRSDLFEREPLLPGFRPRIGITVGPGLAKAPVFARDEELVARIVQNLPAGPVNFPNHFRGIGPVSFIPKAPVQAREEELVARAPPSGAPQGFAPGPQSHGPAGFRGGRVGPPHFPVRPAFRPQFRPQRPHNRFQSPPFVGKLPPHGAAAAPGTAAAPGSAKPASATAATAAHPTSTGQPVKAAAPGVKREEELMARAFIKAGNTFIRPINHLPVFQSVARSLNELD